MAPPHSRCVLLRTAPTWQSTQAYKYVPWNCLLICLNLSMCFNVLFNSAPTQCSLSGCNLAGAIPFISVMPWESLWAVATAFSLLLLLKAHSKHQGFAMLPGLQESSKITWSLLMHHLLDSTFLWIVLGWKDGHANLCSGIGFFSTSSQLVRNHFWEDCTGDVQSPPHGLSMLAYAFLHWMSL